VTSIGVLEEVTIISINYILVDIPVSTVVYKNGCSSMSNTLGTRVCISGIMVGINDSYISSSQSDILFYITNTTG